MTWKVEELDVISIPTIELRESLQRNCFRWTTEPKSNNMFWFSPKAREKKKKLQGRDAIVDHHLKLSA